VEALPHYREAIGMLERVFAETRGQSEEVRQQFAGRFNAYHHELIELLVRLHEQDAGAGHDREALAVASLTQSRIFSELLRQADVNQFVKEDAFKRLYKQRAAAVDQLRALRRESSAFGLSERELGSEEDEDDDNAAAEARTGPQMDARAENLLRQITDAKRKLAETEDALRRRYPRYAELTQPQPVTAAELQQRLLRPGEALLTYAALPCQLVVFAVTRERFAMVALPVGSAELAAKIRAVRAPGEKFAAAGSLAVLAELDPERLHELYRLLAAPVDPMLLQAKHVLVAGDGPLHTLPLEMLITRWGEAERRAFAAARAAGPVLAEYATLPYLGSRGRFSYLPSLTALASQRLYQKPAVAYRNDLVSFADPVFGDAAAGGARPGMTRLPETADEAKEIAKLLGGRSRVYLGDDAQESVAKSLDLRSTRYLHFATHGLLAGEFLSLQQTPQQGRLGQPALALTLVGDLRGEDGLLTMKEVIESLDINAELVVLSACNTAGENETGNGEGFAGLTRSFMYAGARALLVSHWSVESLSTQEFMTDVFRNMKRGRPVGEAVSEARRTMLAGKADGDRSRAHPYFWAPFVHVGD
jgi:CHAT domain-containing protein